MATHASSILVGAAGAIALVALAQMEAPTWLLWVTVAACLLLAAFIELTSGKFRVGGLVLVTLLYLVVAIPALRNTYSPGDQVAAALPTTTAPNTDDPKPPESGGVPPSAPPNVSPTERPRPRPAPRSVELSDCPPSRVDNPPGIDLQANDLIVVGKGGMFRVDREMKESAIASGGYLDEARGVVVGRDRRILVATRACNQGAIVSVDPQSSTQTPIALGFGVPSGLALEPSGTLLVGDENVQRRNGKLVSWGYLVRIDLTTFEQTRVHTFRGTSAAHSIAITPNGSDTFIADGSIQRLRLPPSGEELPADGATRVEVDALDSAQALSVPSEGQMFVADGNKNVVMHLKLGARTPLDVIGHAAFSTLSGLVSSTDGKTLYIAAGSAFNGLGAVFKTPIPRGDTAPSEVWRGKVRAGGHIAIAVVSSVATP